MKNENAKSKLQGRPRISLELMERLGDIAKERRREDGRTRSEGEIAEEMLRTVLKMPPLND